MNRLFVCMSDKLQHWKYKHGLGPHANDTRQNVQMRHAGGWTQPEGGMIDGEEGWRGMRNKQRHVIILERLK